MQNTMVVEGGLTAGRKMKIKGTGLKIKKRGREKSKTGKTPLFLGGGVRKLLPNLLNPGLLDGLIELGDAGYVLVVGWFHSNATLFLTQKPQCDAAFDKKNLNR